MVKFEEKQKKLGYLRWNFATFHHFSTFSKYYSFLLREIIGMFVKLGVGFSVGFGEFVYSGSLAKVHTRVGTFTTVLAR